MPHSSERAALWIQDPPISTLGFLALADSCTCHAADPVIKIAIEPKSKGDLEKMSNGLIKLAQEDPSFNFSRDEETNQTVIEGMGELHLDIIVDRLRREFKVRRS